MLCSGLEQTQTKPVAAKELLPGHCKFRSAPEICFQPMSDPGSAGQSKWHTDESTHSGNAKLLMASVGCMLHLDLLKLVIVTFSPALPCWMVGYRGDWKIQEKTWENTGISGCAFKGLVVHISGGANHEDSTVIKVVAIKHYIGLGTTYRYVCMYVGM